MTAYFDNAREGISMPDASVDDLWAIDEALVRDVSICAAWPGMPGRFSAQIHECVLEYSWAVNTEALVRACPRDIADYVNRLHTLEHGLHDVFHALAEWAFHAPCDTSFSDDPRQPLTELYWRAKRARFEIAERNKKCAQ
jgi:hypothetical protein